MSGAVGLLPRRLQRPVEHVRKDAACTLSSTHLIGRYSSDRSTAYPGGSFDVTFTPPGSFSGFYTADDPQFPGQFPYSGTFVAHTTGDGCCPVPPSGGPTTAPTANAPFGTPVTMTGSAES